MNRSEKMPVALIMYHSLINDIEKSGLYTILPEAFENDIKYLKNNGYNFITVTDVIDFVNGKRDLPDKPIMITLDDGHYNNYLYAFPVMKKYSARCVISVLGKPTDEEAGAEEEMSEYSSHLTWRQIREMYESGFVEIQNHTYDLHTKSDERIGTMKNDDENFEEYAGFLSADIMKLQNLLKEKTGIAPNAFTYPFGSISPESVEVLKSLGFEAAIAVDRQMNYIAVGDGEALYRLKRINRPHGPSSEEFFSGILFKD